MPEIERMHKVPLRTIRKLVPEEHWNAFRRDIQHIEPNIDRGVLTISEEERRNLQNLLNEKNPQEILEFVRRMVLENRIAEYEVEFSE